MYVYTLPVHTYMRGGMHMYAQVGERTKISF